MPLNFLQALSGNPAPHVQGSGHDQNQMSGSPNYGYAAPIQAGTHSHSLEGMWTDPTSALAQVER